MLGTIGDIIVSIRNGIEVVVIGNRPALLVYISCPSAFVDIAFRCSVVCADGDRAPDGTGEALPVTKEDCDAERNRDDCERCGTGA